MQQQNRKPLIIILAFVFIFLCCLISACCVVMWRNVVKNKWNFSDDEMRAINYIKAKYHDVIDYPNDSQPYRSIKMMKSGDGWYVAFIQQGSSRPILQSKCFYVDLNKNVEEIGTYLPDTSDDSAKDFSPKTCLPVDSENSSSSSSKSDSDSTQSTTSTVEPSNNY